MDHSAKGFAAIVQLLSDPVHDPTKSAAGWQRPVCCSHQPVQRRTEIVCPKPVRPVRAPPCLVDRPRTSSLNMTFQIQAAAAAEMELLDFLLGQNGDFEPDGDVEDRFFLGTPPARTGNPIVNDAEFRKQNLAAASEASPVKYSPYPTTVLPSTPRASQKGTGSYPPSSSALSTVPNTTRIVGFPSACSDPHSRRRVVSALA